MTEEKNEKKVESWRDVRITVELPLYLIVDFLNSLNQRLSNVEDLVTTVDAEGKPITLTNLYKKQAEDEISAQPDEETTGE